MSQAPLEAGTVDIEIGSGIATISFSHPRSNSMPGALLRQVAGEIDKAGQNPEAKVIVLKSAGEKAFCAGASFDELQAAKNLEQSNRFFSGFAILILAMRRCPKVIIGRVQGKAVGGGVGIVAASDYVFAHESASIKLSELALGIGPFIIGPAVQRKIGLSNFSAMALDAEWRDANWAKQHGLYTEVCASIPDLDQRVSQFSTKLAQCNPEAVAKLKRVLWEGTEDWEQLLDARANITSKLALTDFVQKAIAAVKS